MYSCSSRLFLFSVYYLFFTDITFLSPFVLGAMLCCPKYPGGGKYAFGFRCFCSATNMHFQPKSCKVGVYKFQPYFHVSLLSKVNAPSLIYNMHNNDNKLPCKNLLRF